MTKISLKLWDQVFKDENDDPQYIDLVSKLLLNEPRLRLGTK